jgi:hypothetical protein
MFSGKGEIQGSIATTGPAINLQTAYAATSHVGIMVNGMNAKWEGYGSEHHSYGEIGLGYYVNTKRKTETGRGLFYADVFGGYGMGNLNVYVDPGPKDLISRYWFQGSYQKFFLQSGAALTLNKSDKFKLSMGFVHRISFVDFSQVSGLSGQTASYTSPISLDKPRRFFHEPAVILKGVLRKFYFTGQVGLNLSTDRTTDGFNYSPIQLSVGIGILLNFKKEIDRRE